MQRNLGLAEFPVASNPGYRGIRARTVALAILFHVVLITALVWTARSHLRVGIDIPAQQHGIGAFVIPAPKPTATTGRARPVQVVEPAPKTPALAPSQPAGAREEAAGSGQATPLIGTQNDAPVRIGAGDRLGLIKKVDPVYPATLKASGVPGLVVLDATIHRDGTIGDVMVLKSSGAEFERAAIEAVKQWRYTPLPYEGIVTVTIRFTP